MLAMVVVLLAPPGGLEAPASVAPASVAPASVASVAPAPGRVVVRGKAENAKISAVVVSPEGGVVYLIELPAWPADQLGRAVEVTGVIEVTDQFKAEVDESGAISQGTMGGDTLLRGATIKVLDSLQISP